MLLFDAATGSVRICKIRSRQPDCLVCGDEPSITELIDYVQFCGAAPTDKSTSIHLLDSNQRVLATVRMSGKYKD